MAYVAVALRKLVIERAKNRCEYCQTQQRVTGETMQIEHIFPEVLGGETKSENLALSCHRCNTTKRALTHYQDPVSGDTVPLFNPRQDRWDEHFTWDDEQIQVIGTTPTGRATVIALNMNKRAIVSARSRWVIYGDHPPRD